MSLLYEGLKLSQMCDVIAHAGTLMFKDNEKQPTSKQIWDNLPNGEIFVLCDWYIEAVYSLGIATEQDIINHYNELNKQFNESAS